MPDYILNALFVFTGLLLICKLLQLAPHMSHPPLRFLMSAVAGLAALLVGNAVGELFGAGLGLNALTLPLSAGLGVPGVALLWFLRYFI